MIKYCFIILHYITVEDTVKCVESIKSLNITEDEISVVIVDNASPNCSGIELKELYKDDISVRVLINDNNEGFSKGNNIGCEYAKKFINPDYYIVLNNDIVIEQKDFCKLVHNLYETYEFDVLGPDIFSIKRNIHQNPIMNEMPNITRVNMTILINKLMCMFYPISIPLMYAIKFSDNKNCKSSNYNTVQENVGLHGACLIMTSKYIKKKKKAFYPETFMYYEEALMMIWNLVHNCKSLYSPLIKVIHNESSSTHAGNSKTIEKWYKGAKIIIDAANIYREEYKKCFRKD